MITTQTPILLGRPTSLFISDFQKSFDPWKQFFDGNDYEVTDSFIERVLKCTSIPNKMPSMSFLNYSLKKSPPDHKLMISKRFATGLLLVDPLEICWAIACLTDIKNKYNADGRLRGEGQKTILGFIYDERVAITYHCMATGKWVLDCPTLSHRKGPVDLIVKVPEVLDISMRKN